VRIRRILWALAGLPLLLGVGGCALLPASGPLGSDVWGGQRDPASLPYALVRVSPPVVDVLARAAPRLAPAFGDRRPPKQLRFGVGDIISVTIFEAAAGGLFIPSEAGVRPGNFITIPNQAVDQTGNVSIPYAGVIRARGRTQVELQQAIVDALRNRAIEPQVVVSLVQAQSSLITVLGDVNNPGRLPANLSGEVILDVISRAGGTAAQGHESWVMLEGNGRRAIAPFGALIYEPINNVYVSANDTIYVYREPQSFLAFGAFGGGSQKIDFEAWRLSLAEAVSKAGGPLDSRADAASVFLYRGETRETAERLGIDCSRFQGPLIPVIYNINLRDPAGYFLATKVEMRNKDVIYVSNAISVEVGKFVDFLSTINRGLSDPMETAITGLTLRNLLKGGASNVIVGTSLGTAP
jgi:polysaccharide biosynthesis/export protein